MIPAWLIEALIVGPPCWVLGVVTGVKIQHHKLTREVVVQVRDIKAWLQKRQMVVLGVFLIVMALLTYQSQRDSSDSQHKSDEALAGLRTVVVELQVQNSCLATYANQLHSSLVPRQHAAKQLQAADNLFNDAFVVVLTDIFGGASQAQSKADALALKDAASAKQALADRLNHERSVNPYPPPPKKVCPK